MKNCKKWKTKGEMKDLNSFEYSHFPSFISSLYLYYFSLFLISLVFLYYFFGISLLFLTISLSFLLIFKHDQRNNTPPWRGYWQYPSRTVNVRNYEES